MCTLGVSPNKGTWICTWLWIKCKNWLNWVCKGAGRQTLSTVLPKVARVLRPTVNYKRKYGRQALWCSPQQLGPMQQTLGEATWTERQWAMQREEKWETARLTAQYSNNSRQPQSSTQEDPRMKQTVLLKCIRVVSSVGEGARRGRNLPQGNL